MRRGFSGFKNHVMSKALLPLLYRDESRHGDVRESLADISKAKALIGNEVKLSILHGAKIATEFFCLDLILIYKKD